MLGCVNQNDERLGSPATVVRDTFNYKLNETTDFCTADGERSTVKFCQHVAELKFNQRMHTHGWQIQINTFNPAHRQVSFKLPEKMVQLQAESTQQRNNALCPKPESQNCESPKKKTQAPTDREPQENPIPDVGTLKQRRDDPVSRAQVLIMRPDIVWMGRNQNQEKAWHSSGIVRPKGKSAASSLNQLETR